MISHNLALMSFLVAHFSKIIECDFIDFLSFLDLCLSEFHFLLIYFLSIFVWTLIFCFTFL
jgi:hypothetical protein